MIYPKLLKFIQIFLAVIVISNCSDEQQETVDNGINENKLIGNDYDILFVGNSLTYTNNLPDLVEKEAEKKDIKIGTMMIAKGNYAIIDHWNDGVVQQEISSGKFDFVVIQQGPSSRAEGRQMLIGDGKKYADLCKEHDVLLAYFMVWPSRNYYETYEDVIKNYTDAAELNDAILCPVGKVWKEHFDSSGEFDYYGPDGFHPSLLGSQVAADVIVETLLSN